MKSQKIYSVDRNGAQEALSATFKRFDDGYAYGEERTQKALNDKVNELFADKEFVHVSLIANEAYKMRTEKLPGGANSALNYFIKEINKRRVVE